MSARPCGCDPEARWTCARHQEEEYVERDLNAEAKRVHEANRKWWTDLQTGEYPIKRNIDELRMLVVSELAEAMEGDRKNLPDDKLPHRPMREVELADALIRLLDIAGAYQIVLPTLCDGEDWTPNFAENLFTICRNFSTFSVNTAVVWGIGDIISLAKHYNMDLWGAYEEKMAYNATRVDHSLEHRRGEHGKKY